MSAAKQKSTAISAALVTARWNSSSTRGAVDAAISEALLKGDKDAKTAAKSLRAVLDGLSPASWRASTRHIWASRCRGDGLTLSGRGEQWTLNKVEERKDGAKYAPRKSACPLRLEVIDASKPDLKVRYGGATKVPPADEAKLFEVAKTALVEAPHYYASRLWAETIWPRLLREVGGVITGLGGGSVHVIEGADATAKLRALSRLLAACGQRGVCVARCPVAEVAGAASEGLADELDALRKDAEAALAAERSVKPSTIEAAKALIASSEERLAAYEAALGERLDRLRKSREAAQKKWQQLARDAVSPAMARALRAVKGLGLGAKLRKGLSVEPATVMEWVAYVEDPANKAEQLLDSLPRTIPAALIASAPEAVNAQMSPLYGLSLIEIAQHDDGSMEITAPEEEK